MVEEVVKKKGRGPGKKKVDTVEKTSGLPKEGSIINPAMGQALDKLIRTRDGVMITEKLKGQFSEPVIRNLLNNKYCTDPALYNAVAKILIERELSEKKIGNEMMQARIENMQSFLLLDEKYNELKKAFTNV